MRDHVAMPHPLPDKPAHNLHHLIQGVAIPRIVPIHELTQVTINVLLADVLMC